MFPETDALIALRGEPLTENTMAKQTTQETAAEAYSRIAADIKTQIETLIVKLEMHRGSAQDQPANWGYPGDLGHVKEILANAIEFLGSGK